MTSIELGQLRGVLEARSAELQDLLRNREVIAFNSSAEMLDQIQHASERDMAIGNLERDSARLREVRAALRRIALGTFGTCLDCQEEISLKRLAAVPWTPLCLACREAADGSRILPRDTIEGAFLNVA
jgi:DnaK suppressor protein